MILADIYSAFSFTIKKTQPNWLGQLLSLLDYALKAVRAANRPMMEARIAKIAEKIKPYPRTGFSSATGCPLLITAR